ncbi:MAG: class I SAM-dependent methyltransferase [Candidatus Dormibacteraeota bacterium]|nr:class I SAM-dependent methyltransferase [Candidatus Dormibacteraeota bacterium]
MKAPRLFFRMTYLLGWKPWDSGMPPPELVEWVEGSRALPPGRALDIGCGTGTNARYLLDHKWQVTGVDFVPRAVQAAKRKAPGATLLVGDVTKLAELGVSGPFDLMLDLGCFHSIPDSRRGAYLHEAARVAAPGATLLLFAFAEKRPGGIVATEEEIRRRFGADFDVAEVRNGAAFRKQTWYRMIRKSR